MSVPERPTDPSAHDASASRLPLVDNPLFLAGQADIAAALGIAEGITHKETREKAILGVAVEQTYAGIEPTYPPSFFLDAIRRRKQHQKWDIYRGVALMEAYSGNEEASLELAKQGGGNATYYTDLLEAHARLGADTQPLLSYIYSEFAHYSGYPHIDDVGNFSATQRDLGLTPPKGELDRLKEWAPVNNLYRLKLSIAYSKAGYHQDALDLWKSEEHTGHDYAHALAAVAVALAKDGIDPTDAITEASELVEKYTEKTGDLEFGTKAALLANLARAAAIAKQDARPLIDRALEKVSEDIHYHGFETYIDISRTQMVIGNDPRPVLAVALEYADNEAEDGDDSIALWSQLHCWESIFHVQVEGGLYDDARVTLDRFDRHEIHQNPDTIRLKAQLLAKLGRARILAAREDEILDLDEAAEASRKRMVEIFGYPTSRKGSPEKGEIDTDHDEK